MTPPRRSPAPRWRDERAALPAVACEALEALGRCARVGDLDRAEAAFERARAIATENGLTLWRIRALHELGALDIFRGFLLERLGEARALALQRRRPRDCRPGRPATRGLPREPLRVRGRAGGRRALRGDWPERLHLDVTAAAALLFQAQAYAKLGHRAALERVLAEALRLAGQEPDIVAGVWEGRAVAALVEEKGRRRSTTWSEPWKRSGGGRR